MTKDSDVRVCRSGECRAPIYDSPDIHPSPYCSDCDRWVWAFKPGEEWEFITYVEYHDGHKPITDMLGDDIDGSQCVSCGSFGDPQTEVNGANSTVHPTGYLLRRDGRGRIIAECEGFLCGRVMYVTRMRAREVVF